jgi:septal ring factor EnvC (AmiA/AmiB activator)
MKSKVFIALLFVLCAGLGVVLFIGSKKHQEDKTKADQALLKLTNDLQSVRRELTDQQKVAIKLETNVFQLTEDVAKTSNELATTSAKLAKTESEAKAAAQAAQVEISKRDAKITALETERDDLTKRMTELNVSITTLEKQITETEKQLAASEGDRTFLLKELKRLQAEKADLERQFNNLAFLREQVSKLRAELSIAKRLEWLRNGIYGTSQKTMDQLQQGYAAPTPQTNYNLNVELRQDGNVKVISTNTNTPPSTNAPPTP